MRNQASLHLISRRSMIVRMIVAPNKTVVDSDWCFEENTVNFRLQAPYLKSPPAIS